VKIILTTYDDKQINSDITQALLNDSLRILRRSRFIEISLLEELENLNEELKK
jgi:hypothetical protein